MLYLNLFISSFFTYFVIQKSDSLMLLLWISMLPELLLADLCPRVSSSLKTRLEIQFMQYEECSYIEYLAWRLKPAYDCLEWPEMSKQASNTRLCVKWTSVFCLLVQYYLLYENWPQNSLILVFTKISSMFFNPKHF